MRKCGVCIHMQSYRNIFGVRQCTAADIINFSLVYALKMDALKHVWMGKDVSYNHVTVFGCRAFSHILKDERCKLDDKARSSIYLKNS